MNSKDHHQINIEIKLGDVLISHRKHKHYLVESINSDQAIIRWLHRKSGEPVMLYKYSREIKLSSARVITKSSLPGM